MTNTKPDKPERQTKEQTKGNLGQKEARPEERQGARPRFGWGGRCL